MLGIGPGSQLPPRQASWGSLLATLWAELGGSHSREPTAEETVGSHFQLLPLRPHKPTSPLALQLLDFSMCTYITSTTNYLIPLIMGPLKEIRYSFEMEMFHYYVVKSQSERLLILLPLWLYGKNYKNQTWLTRVPPGTPIHFTSSTSAPFCPASKKRVLVAPSSTPRPWKPLS